MGAAVHFDFRVHNFAIQEYMSHTSETDRVSPMRTAFKRWIMHPGEIPGIDMDEKLAAQFPYQRALSDSESALDGTVHRW
jgi:mannonate dehydratase